MSILNLYSNLDFFVKEEVRKVKIKNLDNQLDQDKAQTTVVDLITFYNKHYLT